MREDIYHLLNELKEIGEQACEVYLPLVEDLCKRDAAAEEEISNCLDYLLDFAYYKDVLELYKKLCRYFVYIYPSCISLYINAYREMWEE